MPRASLLQHTRLRSPIRHRGDSIEVLPSAIDSNAVYSAYSPAGRIHRAGEPAGAPDVSPAGVLSRAPLSRRARDGAVDNLVHKAALARITGANGIATTTARDRLAYNTVAREIFHA